MAYEVRLEVFEGPIDLLLHLITRQRVDIYEVSIATITEEYLAAVDRMETLDLETATGFLVVAATLLELKSARLLPHRSWDEGDVAMLEERDLLLARLVECATFRGAGSWLSGALEAGEAFHGRSVALEGPLAALAPDLLARVTTDDIGWAAARALAPRPVPELDTSHVAPIRASVREAIVTIAGLLMNRPQVSFAEVCPPGTPRIEVVVSFLALLELYKAGAVDIGQAERFGEIQATWTGEVSAGAVADEAEEYALEGEGS